MLQIAGCIDLSHSATLSFHGAGNGLIQLVDYKRDEFEWRHQGGAGGILSLALQPDPQ